MHFVPATAPNPNPHTPLPSLARLRELGKLADPVLDEVDALSDQWEGAWSESQKQMLVEGFVEKVIGSYKTFKEKLDEFHRMEARLLEMGGGLEPDDQERLELFGGLTEVIDRWMGMSSLDRIMDRW